MLHPQRRDTLNNYHLHTMDNDNNGGDDQGTHHASNAIATASNNDDTPPLAAYDGSWGSPSTNRGRPGGVDSDSEEDNGESLSEDRVRRSRRVFSSSSSSESPFRSCHSSLSPQSSLGLFDQLLLGEPHCYVSDDTLYYSEDDAYRFAMAACEAKGNNSEESTNDNFESDEDHPSDHLGYDFHTDQFEGWKGLPSILLEDIFVMLSPKERHQASMVCRPWYDIFYSPRVWDTFVLFERTLTKRRFNLYKGYQRELCPRKTQICLVRVGCYFKRIVVTPIADYYNLYEFLRVLSSFLTFYPEFPMPLLHTFRFTFACESRGVNGVIIIGTGGNILEKLKDLVNHMQQLRHLALNELLLDVEEVPGLLAAAAIHCTDSLHSLELLNCTKVPLGISEVTQFEHMLKLTLSPQHLTEELVLLLGGMQLLELHLVQDAYTCPCVPVSSQAWKLFKDMAPAKRVFLEVQGLTKTPLLLQPHAPVRGVVFRTPYHRLHPEMTTWLLEYYAPTLEYFVQEGLPRAHGSRKFSERADESLLRLVRACPRLHTLVVRERISLATLLLVAMEAKGLNTLVVRKNALLKKCEWPRGAGWSADFHSWLRRYGRNYDLAFQQLPVLLRRRWKPALDKSFKHFRIHVT